MSKRVASAALPRAKKAAATSASSSSAPASAKSTGSSIFALRPAPAPAVCDARRVRDRFRRQESTGAGTGPVVYWMSRDQRLEDNWALVHAADEARRRSSALLVTFCLTRCAFAALLLCACHAHPARHSLR